VAFDHGQLKYREYDGVNWGSIVTLDSDGGDFPQMLFNDNVPAVFPRRRFSMSAPSSLIRSHCMTPLLPAMQI
jgi:hypothetical protein